MPYKYIGRKTDFLGKTLWEIVGNLKNFGVGRIIVRSRFERYPEKCYMKILKVETLPNPEKPTYDDVRLVKVWMENTFRGVTYTEPLEIQNTSGKSDYRLIPKDEEEQYCKTTAKEYTKILPKTMEFPPLLKELLIRNQESKGRTSEEPKLEIFYNQTSLKKTYRVAKDGEKPTVELSTGLGTPISSAYYKNVKINSQC
ncbi:unnamed protein product [Phyllotreta striolata]|uniref:28S ribosomal protein S34, mitochondrial n=1 Tax=Phyllotreta striolata TaxID=444603 RepID=A0A9N9TSU1_PHYSR|nr:unnamed protein product [Phyllotreta striolata]